MKHILLFLILFLSLSSVHAQSGMVNGNDQQSNASTIYPNPATNQISFKFEQANKVASVIIYSIIGNEVLNKKVDQSTNFKLNIQNLKKGKYIVRVFNVDGSTESLSLIKK